MIVVIKLLTMILMHPKIQEYYLTKPSVIRIMIVSKLTLVTILTIISIIKQIIKNNEKIVKVQKSKI